jgi:transcriptional regulator with XRE-family HTH domain
MLPARKIIGGSTMTCKIGEKIRQLRLQHKKTQEQLADRLGVSYQSVSRWENGVTYPDIEFLPAIAKCFSVSLDYLLGQDDKTDEKVCRKTI